MNYALDMVAIHTCFLYKNIRYLYIIIFLCLYGRYNIKYISIYFISGFFRSSFIFAIFTSGFKRRKVEPGEQSKYLKLGLELTKIWRKFKPANMSGAAKRRK